MTFKADVFPGLKSPKTKWGGTERLSRCSGKMAFLGNGESVQSSISVCGQEEGFSLKGTSSWLLAGPGIAFLGSNLSGLKVEGFP